MKLFYLILYQFENRTTKNVINAVQLYVKRFSKLNVNYLLFIIASVQNENNITSQKNMNHF